MMIIQAKNVVSVSKSSGAKTANCVAQNIPAIPAMTEPNIRACNRKTNTFLPSAAGTWSSSRNARNVLAHGNFSNRATRIKITMATAQTKTTIWVSRLSALSPIRG